jgi:hypothetical protein
MKCAAPIRQALNGLFGQAIHPILVTRHTVGKSDFTHTSAIAGQSQTVIPPSLFAKAASLPLIPSNGSVKVIAFANSRVNSNISTQNRLI